MGFLLRDDRHLKGTTPQVQVAPPTRPGHVIASGLQEGRPYLTVRDDDGDHHTLRLDDALNLEVLPDRRCIGRWTDDGPVPCPLDAAADHFDQCPTCHPLPERDCVFNPRCSTCTQEFCRSPHRLYVAYYSELPKVGMTRAARGNARLVEQGADAYTIVAQAVDRADARRLEDRITASLGLPQARRADELLSRMARPVPWDAIANIHDHLVPRLGDLLGMPAGPLERNPPPFGAFPLPRVPTLAGIQGHHAGKVLGAKGRYLLYTLHDQDEGDDPTIWALNLHALGTHRVHFDLEAAARPS